MKILAVGRRIYNCGDMANPDHFGTIIEAWTDEWGTSYRIKPDDDARTYGGKRENPYVIPAALVSEKYSGNGSTRIVTEEAYQAWRKERIAAFEASMRKAGVA